MTPDIWVVYTKCQQNLGKLAGKIAPDGKQFVEKVVLQSGETIEPQVSGWLHIDFRNEVKVGALFEKAGNLIGQSQAFRDIYNNQEESLPEKLQTIFRRLSATDGRVWFVFDNFESLLDGDGHIKNAEWHELFTAIYFGIHNVRILLASRKVPHVLERFEGQFLKLDEVIKLLYAGLPEADCISLLRGRNAHRDLRGDEAEIDAKLKAFAERVHWIPMALVSVAGYLNKRKMKTLDDILEHESLFADFAQARLSKKSEEYFERGLKTLHREQLNAQSANAVIVLRLLAFFNRHVPFGALAHLLPEGELENVLARLEDTDYLITRKKTANQYALHVNDALEINLYGLHPVICENEFFAEQPDPSTLFKTAADKCWERASAASNVNRHAYALELYTCAERLYAYLTKELGGKDLLNNYAAMLMNKGNALQNLTRLDEAIEEYEKAIAILERLVKIEGQRHLANDLATAYGNKALAAKRQEKWETALECYENALQGRAFCLTSLGMFWLLPDMLKLLRYRLMTLLDLERWQPAAVDVMRFIALYTLYSADAAIHDGLKAAATGELEALKRVLRAAPPAALAAVKTEIGAGADELLA